MTTLQTNKQTNKKHIRNFKISKFKNVNVALKIIAKLNFSKFKFSKCNVVMARLPFWSTEKRKVATKLISYKRYREILFPKVALCYLLHFVQDGSSTNAL